MGTDSSPATTDGSQRRGSIYARLSQDFSIDPRVITRDCEMRPRKGASLCFGGDYCSLIQAGH